MFQIFLSNNVTFQLNDLIIYVLITLPSPGLQEMNSYILILFFLSYAIPISKIQFRFLLSFYPEAMPPFHKKNFYIEHQELFYIPYGSFDT